MPNNINFFIPCCQIKNISEARFGICDPQNGGQAFVDFINEENWVAIVENRTGQPVNFTAEDSCVEIRRDDGTMDFRCDAMLTGAGYIIFIELKDQKDNWINHAVNDQLQTTIDHFKHNHDINQYTKRLAYACNKRHPKFQYSNMEMMNDFRNRNKVRLIIANEIILK